MTEVASGKVRSGDALLVAAYPLLFFYLVACLLTGLKQHDHQITHGWRLLGFAIGLLMLEQVLKTIVTAAIPENASIPIVEGWFHIAHVRNARGSWIAGSFGLPDAPFFQVIQWVMVVTVLVLAVVYHRYYTTRHRQSLWVDVAFLSVLAAYTSWMWDTIFRGYVIDFIQLPGLVTADLKDILVSISAAAVIAEVLEQHRHTDRSSTLTKQEYTS